MNVSQYRDIYDLNEDGESRRQEGFLPSSLTPRITEFSITSISEWHTGASGLTNMEIRNGGIVCKSYIPEDITQLYIT